MVAAVRSTRGRVEDGMGVSMEEERPGPAHDLPLGEPSGNKLKRDKAQ